MHAPPPTEEPIEKPDRWHILLVEDDPDDAELVAIALERAGLAADFTRVDTAEAMNDVLDRQDIHLVLSDFAIPGFGGREALELLQARELDIPFLIISGELGETNAVSLMKAGVADYVPKGNLARLVPAVERELSDSAIRRARRKAEKSLRDSQYRYETLIKSIDGIVWEAEDLPGPYRFVSPQAETLLGFPPTRWVEDPDFWQHNIHSEDRSWVVERYRAGMKSGRPFQLEYRRTTARGAVLWLRDVVSPAPVQTGAEYDTAVRGVTFDVTERRTAEEERERLLRLTEQRAGEMSIIARLGAALRAATTRRETLAAVMETLQHLLPVRALSFHTIHDAKLGPLELSYGEWPDGYLSELGADSSLGDLITTAFEPVLLPIPSRFNLQPHIKMIGLPLRAQGDLMGVLLSYYAPYAEEATGSTLSVAETRLFTALADIIAGALYRAELYEETRIMASQMQTVMMSTPQGLILLDQDRNILLTNPVAQRALHVLAPESASAMPSARLHRLGEHQLHLERRPRSGHETRFELTVEAPSLRTFEVILSPVNTEFASQRWLLTVTEVTEERLAQQRIQDQNRLAAIGQLAAGIAHDFNNSLGVIRLYTDLVHRHADLSERDRGRLQTVSKQIGHATHLIHQILDFSRRSIIQRQTLNLHELVADMVAILQHTLSSNIQLTYYHDHDSYPVEADKTRLQQVIFNLVVNARDAMPEGGTLDLALSSTRVVPSQESFQSEIAAGEWITLRVRDTGHGVEARHISQLFEPFFTTKPTGHGTGLGLAQVYGIVKQHNGHITVESQVDVGTEFTLWFPRQASSDTLDAPPEIAAPTPRHRHILVVEDDPAGRQAMNETLQEQGYLVTTAENGQEALAKVLEKSGGFDLIVSDLVMPQMSGIQLFHELQARHIPIPMILVTGYPLADGGQELLQAGIVDWLAKPFQIETLCRKIESVFQTT